MATVRKANLMQGYSVMVEHDLLAPIDDDRIETFFEAFQANGVDGAVIGVGQDTISARFSLDDGDHGEAGYHGAQLFVQVAEKVEVPLGAFRALEVKTHEALERELNAPPQRYAGITEVAEILGVSKQRVSELRQSGRFPSPVAEIAAGPVWTVSSLDRFIDTWDRRPGRRAQVRTDAEVSMQGKVTTKVIKGAKRPPPKEA